MNLLEQLTNELALIDRILLNLDRALDSAQPNLEGKIRLFFWYTQGKKYPPQPVIVSRERLKQNYPTKISENNLVKKARSRGPFQKNYHATRRLLQLTAEIIKYRKRIKNKILAFETSARATIHGNTFRLEQAEKEIIKLNNQIMETLRSSGLQGFHVPITEPVFPKH